MLRNHYWWTWRLFVAFLFLIFFYNPAARGGPMFGRTSTPTPPPVYPAPSTYTISGYVFIDSAKDGVKLPSASGISSVQMQLLEYSLSNLNASIGSYTVSTDSAGYYSFGNLTPGNVYTLKETQPANYTSSLNTVGYFLSSSGGTLVAPSGINGYPSTGIQNPNIPDTIYNISLPQPTGEFVPNTAGGKYAAMNYLFGEFVTPPPPPPPPPPPTGSTPAILGTNLAVLGGNNRFLAGGSLNLTGTVTNSAVPGSSNLNWQISSLSSGMSLTPSDSTNVGPGVSSILSGSIGGASLPLGTQNATLSVSGTSTSNSTTLSSTTSVSINPVLSRVIDSVTPANFGRLMQGGTASANLTVTSAGSHDHYTDLTMNAGALTVSDSNGTATGTNSTPVTFNGTTKTHSAAVAVAFSNSASGPIGGTVVIPGNTGLFTGEALASGTPVLPTLNVPYTATVLRQQQLIPPTDPFEVPTTAGGLLYGAVVPIPTSYAVMSTSESNHVTNVYVTGGTTGVADAFSTDDGTTPVGKVSVTKTRVDHFGITYVPVQVGAQSWGPIHGSASLSVVTAEADSVHDTAPYAPVSATYHINNVGNAVTGGSDTENGNPNTQLFGAPLSAPFKTGSQLSPSVLGGPALSSRVVSGGTAGTDSTALNTAITESIRLTRFDGGPINEGNVYGTVGSQCDILASTALTTNATVTMAWRNRNNAENGSTEPLPPIFDPGIWCLTSDVVEIAGVPKKLTFAMQMTFEDSINQFLGSVTPGTLPGSYIGKMVNGKWVNAVSSSSVGGKAQIDVPGSLSAFLAAQYAQGYTLDALAGSWGVDFSVAGGVGYSWAIINGGGGNFAVMSESAPQAVVPEPSTLVLLGACVAGLLVYRVRRKAQNKPMEV